MEHAYRAGQSWTDSTTQVHAAGNTGSGKARLLTNFLLPDGAPQITVVQESQFGPAVVHEAKFPLPPLPADAEIVQQVIDLAPGSRTEQASHGFAAGLVVDGEVRIGAERKPYTPGDAWTAPAGSVIALDNSGPRQAQLFITHLLPKGAAP